MLQGYSYTGLSMGKKYLYKVWVNRYVDANPIRYVKIRDPSVVSLAIKYGIQQMIQITEQKEVRKDWSLYLQYGVKN